MDVASIKKNFVDSATGGKGGSSAEQLMADFSAAVAARMTSVHGHSAEQSKNKLVDRLGAHAASPKQQAEAAPQAPRDDVQDAHPAYRSDDRADERAPAERPRETHEADNGRADDAPAAQAQDAPATADRPETDDAGANRETAQAHDDGKPEAAADNAPQAQDGAATEVAAAPAAAQAQTSAAGNAAEVLSAVAGKAETAVTKDGAPAAKQHAQHGLDVAKDAGAKHAASGDAAKPDADGAQGGVETGLDGQKTAKAAKAQAGQAQGKPAAAQSTVQQQAAELSRTVGQDQRLNVNVSVTKQANELSSQPTQNLSAQAAQGVEEDGLLPDAAQAAGKGQSQKATLTQNAGKNGSEGQAQNQSQGQGQAQAQAQNQAVQQGQLQAAQAETVKAAGGDAKAQGMQAATAVQGAAKAGGAEGASPAQTATPANAATQTQQAAAPAKPHAAAQAHARANVAEQVSVQISKAITDGNDTIRIQLKPAHLGRVDVQLELGKDGQVSAVVTADSKETLDLLKQDARELQRAMREAGLQMDSSDLSFNLRGESGGQAQDGEATAQAGGASAEPVQGLTLDELLEAQTGRKDVITDDRVDITV